MAKLRREFRSTIKRGTEIVATVVSYELGLATVSLTGDGTMLTNLPTLGTAIKVGDEVVVDYSSGEPVVRPIIYTVPVSTAPVVEEVTHVPPIDQIDSDLDIGGSVGFDYLEYDPREFLLGNNVFTSVIFNGFWWESEGMYPIGQYEQSFLTITDKGKYYVYVSWLPNTGALDSGKMTGQFAYRVLLNASNTILQMNNRNMDFGGQSGYGVPSGMTIEALDVDDTLTLQLLNSVWETGFLVEPPTGPHGLSLTAVLISGTEEIP